MWVLHPAPPGSTLGMALPPCPRVPALSCVCSDPSRIKKPEVFLLPKDAKKNASGKSPQRAAGGFCFRLSWSLAEMGCFWAGTEHLSPPPQTSRAPSSCRRTEPSPTTRRAPSPRWLSKLGTWWTLWRRARAVSVRAPRASPVLATTSAGLGSAFAPRVRTQNPTASPGCSLQRGGRLAWGLLMESRSSAPSPAALPAPLGHDSLSHGAT